MCTGSTGAPVLRTKRTNEGDQRRSRTPLGRMRDTSPAGKTISASPALERPESLAHAAELGATPDHVDRQQELFERLELSEHVVGENAHVATHAADQIEQRQGVERAERMIGDHDQRPFRGNVLAVGVGDLVAEVEVLEHAPDEGKASLARKGRELTVDPPSQAILRKSSTTGRLQPRARPSASRGNFS